jgi:4-hydroxy-tetrahydrodipicolinate reductase
MGKLALEIIQGSPDLSLHAALDSKSDFNDALGADVIFEATNLEVSKRVVDFAIANSMKVLVATSGWTQAALSLIESRVGTGAVVVVPNFSVGSTLATKFAAEAARYFDSIEIIETHHAGKLDSPSGTAIRTAELISSSREEVGRTEPLISGAGQSARGEVVAGVPIHSLRINGVSAKQEVNLGGADELLTISHTAGSVNAYSFGILKSVKFTAKSTGVTLGLNKVLGI